MDKSKEKKLNRGETSSKQNSLPTADIPTSGRMQLAVQDDSRSKKMTQTGEPVKATENSSRDEDGVSQNDEPDLHLSNEDPPPAAIGNVCTSNTSISDNKGRKGMKAESSDAQDSHQV
ncbi:uncharacterized protein LOC129923326 isoform X2 [Biomphalaria glabrata]|uniref:Uncharacterized protein LOC129923326 isoform X1 n=1 Tax=Biomphalaria glabrata TaxID=6526 RepID=A0A9W2Z3Y6_BIOGL|nr:uncharacterized protein LOC129923326 isoform X1 [Biomphalaria glabrata]XP_055869642.1 uncharacterized protein LOC129923326 isoform X2 [Biomphalaria glabrata]